jgi:hypothetical protein
VDEAIADSVRQRLLSAFPEGTFAWVDVLGYGDDPAVMKRFVGKRPDVMDESPGGARVGTWLGPADLVTLDALIMAGVGTSRTEVIRWALGRIRENPAYARLLGRVREIGELRAQF